LLLLKLLLATYAVTVWNIVVTILSKVVKVVFAVKLLHTF